MACTNSVEDINDFKSADTKLAGISNGHRVKYNDILTLDQCQNVQTRTESEASVIECLTNDVKDTMLYVVKKENGGWIMYSSDTRVPAIVALSESGSFDELMQIDGAQLWIQSIIDDMNAIRELPDDMLNFTQEEIESNKTFWKSVSSPDEYVKETMGTSTRAHGDIILPPLAGHYELTNSEYHSEIYDSIDRIIKTNWHQGFPYNIYCPLIADDTTEHAPAGCVAIAGAQMLYFLHDKYNVPKTAPSEAYCNGDINSYTWAQTNYTSEIWDEMSVSGYKAAPLIADVGRRVNIRYGKDGSSAITSDLVNKVFVPYGISCTYTQYNVDQLRNSLSNGMPVLLRASTSSSTGQLGHAFIADRYKRERIVTKNYYRWVYDNPSDKPRPLVDEKIEYTYSSPKITMIGMNWGWGYNYYFKDEWFTLTGDWISKNINMSIYNWNISRHMIYNFQVIN